MAVNIGINIQRSPNRINQNLREAGVLGKYPKLLLDFKDEYYLANGGSKTLANAVTHARAGNATMTDGYGPELVTNGGFDSDSDWTLGTGFSITGGKLQLSDVANLAVATIPITLEANKVYEVQLTVSDFAAGSSFRVLGYSSTNSGASSYITSAGVYRFLLPIDGSGTAYLGKFVIQGIGASSTTTATIDSVSVREMPVIKWAPHNLLTYSEDLSNWTIGGQTLDLNSETAPDGTQTADKLIAQTGSTYQQVTYSNSFSGLALTQRVWAKAAGYNFFMMNGPTAGDFTFFNLSNGTVGTTSGDHSNVTITDAGNGWYLCSVDCVSDGSGAGFGMSNADGVSQFAGNGTDGIYLWGMHLYRSDLGGMVDNPDQPLSRASYVPTTSSAKYLPRIGHHVYNGSAWVNEGLLAESEARTNLTDQSTPDSTWSKSATTITENDIVSPDGNENASKIVETTATSNHFVYYSLNNISYVSGTTYTQSAVLKKGTRQYVQLLGTSVAFGANAYANFDLSDGTVGNVGSGVSSTTVENLGNGWYRCSMTADAINTASGNNDIIASVTSKTAVRSESFTGSTSNYFYVYHAQTEIASTPSSLIPTSGSSVSRAAETFTIPSANLPWPTPQYIGDELVTSGTFDDASALDDWTVSGNGPALGTWNASGYIDLDRNGGTSCVLQQSLNVTDGSVYAISFDVIAIGAITKITTIFDSVNLDTTVNGTGSYEFYGVASGSIANVAFSLTQDSNATASLDNISVRELNNPLSVSIAMDGAMTYADIDAFDKPKMFRWYDSATDRIFHSLDTNNGTGEPKFVQEANNVFDAVQGDGSEYAPDVLVPFNMASRHGLTFLNGAVDGVALTEDTTPTALPDLSATDLSLAYDYMGTVGTFRVWDKDITDDGLVEATNPELEPSLSLEFSGSGTNSYVINDWSE